MAQAAQIWTDGLAERPNYVFKFVRNEGEEIYFYRKDDNIIEVITRAGSIYTASALNLGPHAVRGDGPAIIQTLLAAGFHQEESPQWIETAHLDSLKISLMQMSATNARKWVANTLGQPQLNRMLQRAMTDERLWKRWLSEDFPDEWNLIDTLMDENGLFRQNPNAEYANRPYFRTYLWMHWFIMKLMRGLVNYLNSGIDTNHRLGYLRYTLVDVNTVNVAHFTYYSGRTPNAQPQWSKDIDALELYKHLNVQNVYNRHSVFLTLYTLQDLVGMDRYRNDAFRIFLYDSFSTIGNAVDFFDRIPRDEETGRLALMGLQVE